MRQADSAKRAGPWTLPDSDRSYIPDDRYLDDPAQFAALRATPCQLRVCRCRELARKKAKDRGLENIEFRAGNMVDLGLPPVAFDAVICVLGIFFVPDMQHAVRELWRLLSPGGQLAITTWGSALFRAREHCILERGTDRGPNLY